MTFGAVRDARVTNQAGVGASTDGYTEEVPMLCRVRRGFSLVTLVAVVCLPTGCVARSPKEEAPHPTEAAPAAAEAQGTAASEADDIDGDLDQSLGGAAAASGAPLPDSPGASAPRDRDKRKLGPDHAASAIPTAAPKQFAPNKGAKPRATASPPVPPAKERKQTDKSQIPNVGSVGQDRGRRASGARPPADMFFKHYGVNPTIDTEEQARSTFAADVDTASFSVTRSFLGRGVLPSEAAVRVEEFVNAFDYGYEPPRSQTFNIMAEAAPSPNRRGYHVLHLGVKGKEVRKGQRKAAHLTFVVDVSGSMDADNRLGLVKRSLRLLVDQLDEGDKVGIVTYGSAAREVLQPTSAYRRAAITQAIDGLRTEGATNAEAGLRLGYQMAARHFRDGAVNRVVLCSDGVANVGLTGPAGILDTITREVKRGIKMTTVGFGMGNYNDVLMEQLANKGDGNYYYVDKLAEARKVFVDNLTGTLQVIAKDVKVQLQFDPNTVARHRLIGYENRSLETRQFNDDRVDAGEIGAGHAVTAIYEIKLREGTSGPLATARVRFKQPSGDQSTLVQRVIPRSIVHDETAALSSPTQLSLIAAQFAEKLRGSYWARNLTYDDILRRVDALAEPLAGRADVVELRDMIRRASEVDRRGDKFTSHHGPIARMDFDRVPVLR